MDILLAPRNIFLFFFCSYDLQFKDIHMETHDEKEKFMCTTCNKKFATETHLVMHLNAHSEARVVSCKFIF